MLFGRVFVTILYRQLEHVVWECFCDYSLSTMRTCCLGVFLWLFFIDNENMLFGRVFVTIIYRQWEHVVWECFCDYSLSTMRICCLGVFLWLFFIDNENMFLYIRNQKWEGKKSTNIDYDSHWAHYKVDFDVRMPSLHASILPLVFTISDPLSNCWQPHTTQSISYLL